MNENDINVLNEVYKGTKMAIDGIKYMEDKIQDKEFKKEVKSQYNDYEKVKEKIENVMDEDGKELEEPPTKDKVMEWTSIKMNTAMDDSTSHMAEMLIQGVVMGIIEGVRISNKNPNLNKKAESIVDEFVKIGEDNIQVLKTYL